MDAVAKAAPRSSQAMAWRGRCNDRVAGPLDVAGAGGRGLWKRLSFHGAEDGFQGTRRPRLAMLELSLESIIEL